MEIHVLARQGKSIKAISRELSVARNTVRNHLREPTAARYGPRAPRPTKLGPFEQYLLERIEAAKPEWIPATVLLREIRELGYEGGYSLLKAFVAPYKARAVEDPVVRFETAPGEQLQVDFVVFRRGRERLSAFVATLGYSRHSFVHFVTDEKMETVLDCIRRTFAAIGGVPRHVLFDNMKTVVLERDAYGPGQHRFQPQLLALAKECGFSVRLCRPYRARTKGKVERFNRYLRYSFWVPLKARFKTSGLLVDATAANVEVTRWLRDVANARVHRELHERPVECLARERSHLQVYTGVVVDWQALAQQRVPTPVESLQHPLSVYDQLAVPS